MINRYLDNTIKKIWSDQNRLEIYWRIELYNVLAWIKQGKIPPHVGENLNKANIKFDIDKINQYEQKVNHDIIAYLMYVSEFISPEISKYIHYGLTSNDVKDTTLNYQMQKSHHYIIPLLKELANNFKNKADEYKQQFYIGRTHGQHAEITIFGLRFLLWFDQLAKTIHDLEQIKNRVFTVKISGAVGNLANLNPYNEIYIAQKLNLGLPTINTQITPRLVYYKYFNYLLCAVKTCDTFALEVRQLSRPEIKEVAILQPKTNMGSSTMPHKTNPILAEKVCSLSRYVYGLLPVFLSNVDSWHERDLANSANERICIPDFLATVTHIFQSTLTILKRLYINQQQMAANLKNAGPYIYSGRILELLIMETDKPRYEIYKAIQNMNTKGMQNNAQTLADLLKFFPENININKGKIAAQAVNTSHLTKNVNYIYTKVITAYNKNYNKYWEQEFNTNFAS